MPCRQTPSVQLVPFGVHLIMLAGSNWWSAGQLPSACWLDAAVVATVAAVVDGVELVVAGHGRA
jgi:hypothetical protein